MFDMTVLRKICGVTRKDKKLWISRRKMNWLLKGILSMYCKDEDIFLLWSRVTDFQNYMVKYMEPSGGRPRKAWIDNICQDSQSMIQPLN